MDKGFDNTNTICFYGPSHMNYGGIKTIEYCSSQNCHADPLEKKRIIINILNSIKYKKKNLTKIYISKVSVNVLYNFCRKIISMKN